ncbi:MAG: thioredoxin-dependent thiol peroxidase [Candidatus Aenigmatarchaeota archaeon]|nr:thioredoxin-dependent thiol peroxidase [Nanoarchaeota archaeon]
MIKEGSQAPEFSLKDSEGKTHKLSDYRGKKIVLYFYPRDNTPGCTKEACNFRDDDSEIRKRNGVVLGVSGDSEESHKKFQEKHKLPFTLLSDPEKEVIKRYGAWKEKRMYGKTFLGIQRSTFLIDEKGNVIKVFPNVKVDNHSKEILDLLKD